MRYTGFRFRRRAKLFPGLWINLSKTGASVSAGVRGITVNSARGKVKTAISAPGTGLSYTTTSTPKPPPITLASTTSALDGAKNAPTVRPMIWIALTLAIVVTVYLLTK